jgi:hypothetical protein
MDFIVLSIARVEFMSTATFARFAAARDLAPPYVRELRDHG